MIIMRTAAFLLTIVAVVTDENWMANIVDETLIAPKEKKKKHLALIFNRKYSASEIDS